ncbi:MAG TPA: DUF3147 family protein [Gaiellaceae bacterium]
MSSTGVDIGKLRKLSARDLAIRFAAGAATSLAAGLVGTLASARLAGPLLAFPAIYLAGLTLVERKEGEGKAHEVAVGAIAGAGGLLAFAVAVDVAAADMRWPWALLVGLAVWVAVSLALYGAGRALTRR